MRWRSISKRLIARNVSTICRPDARRAARASASSASSASSSARGQRRRRGSSRRGRRRRATGRRRLELLADRRAGPANSSAAIARYGFGAAVADADLDARRRAALGRDADERRAGCPSPSCVRRRERVGHEAAVGVDGRVQERHQRGRVGEHAGGEVAQLGARRRRRRRGRRTRCRRRGPSEKCRWKPEPPWSLNGLPMNVGDQAVDARRRP